ncbi:hypothetical protein SEVIR_J003710v4 [Setaria viridis]|uniref:Uncharacterized protein n=1 Tax=Setaria viridis TaxID=4556 RepID=A0ACC3P266_SETVI
MLGIFFWPFFLSLKGLKTFLYTDRSREAGKKEGSRLGTHGNRTHWRSFNRTSSTKSS